MTAREIIEILKESHLWTKLAPQEKQEAVVHALKITSHLSSQDEQLRDTVGEVYLE